MIDITPFQNKLTWLGEWINNRIDGTISPPMWVNLGILDFKHSIEDIVRIYQQVGVMYYKPKDVIENPAIPVSFEEYCKYKQSVICHNT